MFSGDVTAPWQPCDIEGKKESESRSVVSDSVTPWTIQSMEFSRSEYWSGHPFPSPGDLPNPGIESRSATLQEDSFPAEPPGMPDLDGKQSIYLQQFCTHIIILFFTFNTVFKKLHEICNILL